MDRIIEKKIWTTKRISGIVIGSLAVIAVGYNLVFGDHSSKVNVVADRLMVSTVRAGQFQEFIPVTGAVIPIRTIYLDAVEGGRVEMRFLEAGALVQEGDPILRLSNTTLLLDIMYREAELFQQSNNLRNTQLAMEQNRLRLQSELVDLDYQLIRASRVNDRNLELQAKQLISAQEFEASNDEYLYLVKRRALTLQSHHQDSIFRATQIDQLANSLQRMEDNLQLVKQNQDNLLLRAPVTGHLTSLNAEIGETKTRGERLGQIDILDGFKARVSIDEHYITRIESGQTGNFPLGNRNYELTIVKVYPEVMNGQFEVDMYFGDEVPEDIRRGQTLRIRLALGDLSDATLVSRGGFFQNTGGQWVYVMDESGSFATKRRIRLGRQNQDDYEVLEGLNIGEKIITSSYDNFGDFDKLVIND